MQNKITPDKKSNILVGTPIQEQTVLLSAQKIKGAQVDNGKTVATVDQK